MTYFPSCLLLFCAIKVVTFTEAYHWIIETQVSPFRRQVVPKNLPAIAIRTDDTTNSCSPDGLLRSPVGAELEVSADNINARGLTNGVYDQVAPIFLAENQKRILPNTPNTCLLYTSPSPRD